MSKIEWLITPQMIAILLICLYVIQWLIYPEAIAYICHLGGYQPAHHSLLFFHIPDQNLLIELVGDNRKLYANLEAGIGILRSSVLCALLVTCLLYLRKVTQSRKYLRSAMLPIVAFALKIPQSLVQATLILSYPDISATGVVIARALKLLSIGVYVLAGILILIGAYRYLSGLIRSH